MIHLLIDDDRGLRRLYREESSGPLNASEVFTLILWVPKYDSLAYYYLCGEGALKSATSSVEEFTPIISLGVNNVARFSNDEGQWMSCSSAVPNCSPLDPSSSATAGRVGSVKDFLFKPIPFRPPQRCC